MNFSLGDNRTIKFPIWKNDLIQLILIIIYFGHIVKFTVILWFHQIWSVQNNFIDLWAENLILWIIGYSKHFHVQIWPLYGYNCLILTQNLQKHNFWILLIFLHNFVKIAQKSNFWLICWRNWKNLGAWYHEYSFRITRIKL